MTPILEFSSFTKVFVATCIVLLLEGLYLFVIRPCRQLSLYTKIPGSIVSFNLSSKTLKTWSNAPKSNFKPDPRNQISSSKLYEVYLKHPKLRFEANNLFHYVLLTITDSKIIGEYYKNGKCYQKQSRSSFMRSLYTLHGLSNSEGETWKFQRKIISEVFHFDNLAKTVPIIEETIKELLDNIEFKVNEKETEVIMIDEFQKIAGEIIGRTFFGQNLNDYKINGKSLTLELADLIVKNSAVGKNYFYQLFGDFLLPFSAVLRQIRKQTIMFGEFSKHLVRDSVKKIERNEMGNENGRKGLLQVLVEKAKTEKGLSEKELVANFISFFVAGMDTTGHTTGMAVYLLSQNPKVKEKLMKEIDDCWDGKSPITNEILQKMDYMHAMLEETLRLATPAPGTFPRIALQDHYLGDIPVKKGTIVRPVFTPSMFREDLYKGPFVFRPERWIKGNPFYERPSDPFAFTPFSAGSRNCIGQHMSIMEAKLILCHFLKKFDFHLMEGYKLEMVLRFLAEPKDPMKFILTKRE